MCGVSKQQALTALGSIANLYCFYALASSEDVETGVQAFTSETIAERRAVLGEIRRALPGIADGVPESILAALTMSLDHIFQAKNYKKARLTGFGVLQLINLERSEYELKIELPLAEAFPSRSVYLDRGMGAAGD